jgi:mono/diheme cytochrome c family protein
MWVSMLKRVMVAGIAFGTAVSCMGQNVPLPDGPGKAVVEKVCTGCHGTAVIAAKRATPEQWANTVQQMVSRGADATDEEIETITRYLSTNFPPVKDDKTAPPPTAAPPAQSLNPRFASTLR